MSRPLIVSLVLDKHFGQRAKSLAADMHVWLIESAENRECAQQYWESNKGQPYSVKNGLTLFQAGLEDGSEDIVEEMMGTILEHHATLKELRVYCQATGHRLYETLESYGFECFSEHKEYFSCRLKSHQCD